MQLLNLVYLVKRQEEKICLGLKLRGFGESNYNGFGGKLEDGESIKEAAVRELYEESLVEIKADDLEQVADITFVFEDKILRVPTFFVYEWVGAP
jgi:8-oxo-dGTP diphosphatase